MTWVVILAVGAGSYVFLAVRGASMMLLLVCGGSIYAGSIIVAQLAAR